MTPKVMTMQNKTHATTQRWIGCLKLTNFAFTCEVKSNLMVELEVIFENQVKGEDYLDLDDSF
jgi:hypothetical protein